MAVLPDAFGGRAVGPLATDAMGKQRRNLPSESPSLSPGGFPRPPRHLVLDRPSPELSFYLSEIKQKL